IMGSGTYVTYFSGAEQYSSPKLSVSEAKLSAWGQRLLHIEQLQQSVPNQSSKQVQSISFALGHTDLNNFPQKEWNRLMYEQVREQYKKESVDAYSSEGHEALRESIAQHLHTFRGINVKADDVVIVNGSQQAISFII